MKAPGILAGQEDGVGDDVDVDVEGRLFVSHAYAVEAKLLTLFCCAADDDVESVEGLLGDDAPPVLDWLLLVLLPSLLSCPEALSSP